MSFFAALTLLLRGCAADFGSFEFTHGHAEGGYYGAAKDIVDPESDVGTCFFFYFFIFFFPPFRGGVMK